jgi:hypothetical protein
MLKSSADYSNLELHVEIFSGFIPTWSSMLKCSADYSNLEPHVEMFSGLFQLGAPC